MSERFGVTKRKVTRYFVMGRGFSSEINAYMQLAKVYLDNRRFLDTKDVCGDEFWKARQKWYVARYPKREGCKCFGCEKATRKPEHFYGCTKAKTDDLRALAEKIRAGQLDPWAEIKAYHKEIDPFREKL